MITLSYTDPSTGNDVNAIQDSLGNDAASLVNQTVVNATSVKAPWTLLVSTDNLLYASDGTAAGTGDISSAILNNSYFYGHKLTVNSDKSKAILQADIYSWTTQLHYKSVYASDGSATGTQLLANNVNNQSTPYLLGSKVVIPDGGSSTYTGLVTDGSVSGTTVIADLPTGILDNTNQSIWHAVSTVPYGSELFRTVISGSGATTSMVKDIWSGSSGSYSGSGALLPNGKLVFVASDGSHGSEPWVSDGTDAGTFMLADLWGGANGYIYGLTTFGNKVSLAAIVENSTLIGQTGVSGVELVFTDGTTAGTTFLDINPGGGSSNPTMLGQANGLLYFTATAPNASNVTTLGIFSTNGSTFTRLADINSGASLLGWNASKAYFKVSDATHGAELWAADLVNGGIALVKDLLTGTGSALGATDSSNSLVIGSKLAFNAYTSATAQNFFLSDGTDSGTVKLGGLATASKVVGSTLIFADAAGIYGVNANAVTPAPAALTSGLIGTAGLQADADQVFFTTANGDLFVSNGSTAGTVKLAGSVTSFKVVAENALYFIQDTPADPAALWYSDTSLAGTRYVEDLPSSVTDLSNSVAIVTVGVVGV